MHGSRPKLLLGHFA